MPVAHAAASGMCGLRAAGDLVARMQITRGMRLQEAKSYVAGRLGVTPGDLSDPQVMETVRRELQLGCVITFETTHPTESSAIEAKFRIGELLDLPVNCVRRFADRAGVVGVQGAAR
jgi:dimethylamine--corrinoid protein Co-methyltransferase